MSELNLKKNGRSKKVNRELTASERIAEIDEQVDVLLAERRNLLSKLDEEIAEMQRLRAGARTRSFPAPTSTPPGNY